MNRQLQKRYKFAQIFEKTCLASIIIVVTMLFIFIASIISQSWGSLFQAQINLTVNFDQIQNKSINEADEYLKTILHAEFINDNNIDKIHLYKILSLDAAVFLKTKYKNKTGIMSVWLPASSIAGLYFKKRNLVSASAYMYILDKLKRDNKLRLKFSLNLFTHTDSKEPESAGILGGIVGSFLTITICILCTLPIGVLSALFLEEYMKKSLLKSILEININNLAAVPSIVYGLLGLAIFINILGVPRSSSLVGGMTLALMTLPTIIVTTRQSIKAIPSSIKYGVLAIGASPMQTTMDFTLPLAMPGITTGTLLSIARAIGETAPLIMLGMIAFIVDIPEKFTDPTTVVPVLIYTWSDSAEYGFLEKTSAAILVLIILIIILNYLALTLRKKHELR